MENTKAKERWDNAQGYEKYVGRWSRLISVDFVNWLDAELNQMWLEFGCGTGALTQAIAEKHAPSYLLALDKSETYLEQAKANVTGTNILFLKADLTSLSLQEKFDNITSGLVLNFIPHVEDALRSLVQNLKRGGQLSSFVWDYAGHYQPMRHFWDAAKEVNVIAKNYDTGTKFDICRDDNLIALFERAGLKNVTFTNLERIATFHHFDDYWLPIASAQGSVTEFISLLTVDEKEKLKQLLKQRLPIAHNGEIKLIINALAVKGTKR
jgi:ubiquinone/menaquinone biosynthesis C-methylase UbiE